MGEPGVVSAAHERLKPFAGTFRAEVRMWLGPGEPQVLAGTMVASWDLGGRFLKQVYTGDPPGFEGRGYWGFNTATGNYEGFWIDTASTMMQCETGRVDDAGKVWTMSGQLTSPQTGQPMTKRSVITLLDPDTHRIEMYFAAPGKDETKAMEILYRRAAS